MITKIGNVILSKFDPKFRKSISGYYNTTLHKEGIYHTIIKDGEKAGIIGFIPRGNNKFEQIAILPKYRGQNLTSISSKLLMKKHNIKELTAHIDDDNIASIKAHLKANFKRNSKLEKELRALNKLTSNSKLYTINYDN